MSLASRFIHPIDFSGSYPGNWAGYVFKEQLPTGGRHTGVDYNGAGAGDADYGQEIYSIANGVVRYIGDQRANGFGNMTIVEYPLHPQIQAELGCSSLFARYMHQEDILVSVGQEVQVGQLIGHVGNTYRNGVNVLSHCHIDLYKDTIDGGGVHFRYDNNTELQSYLDAFLFIEAHKNEIADAPQLLGTQRKVANVDGVNGRSAPNTDAEIVQEYPAGEILDFRGYVSGQDPYGNGNNIWFVGAYHNNFWYSGAFEDANTHDLPNLTDELINKPADPAPTITYPMPTADTLVTQVTNKKHPLGADYAPADLIAVDGQQLRAEAAEALRLMRIAAAADHVSLNVGSGYRSYGDQQKVYAQYVAQDGAEAADTYSARPGFSEHQTGLAMDFSPIDDSFKNLPASQWLMLNAYKFGWVLRYPENGQDVTGYIYEPWHYRYIGVVAAADMQSKGTTTLEQYYNVTGGDYAKSDDPDTTPDNPTPSEPSQPDENSKPTLWQLLIQLLEKAVEWLRKNRK